MNPDIARLLLVGLVIAIALVGYELGRSTEPYSCPECQHCRERRLDDERRAREAAQQEDKFQVALRQLALPGHHGPDIRVVSDRRAGRVALSALRKVLVAYDGSDAAKRALDLGLGLARSLGARVSVVSVVPFHYGRLPIDPWDDQEVHAKELLEARDLAASRGVAVELIEPVGEPAEKIERTAELGDFDAVLVGSSTTPLWMTIFGGSVASRLASRCHRTVIVVR